MRAADRLFPREPALGALPGKNSRPEEACGMTMALQVPPSRRRLVAGRGRGGPIDSRKLGIRDGGMGGGVPVSGPLTRLSALETGTKPPSFDLDAGDWLQMLLSGAEELPKEDATQSPSGKDGVHSGHWRPISSRHGFPPRRVLAGTAGTGTTAAICEAQNSPRKDPVPLSGSVDHGGLADVSLHGWCPRQSPFLCSVWVNRAATRNSLTTIVSSRASPSAI
jgi:hypothetical protein